MRLEASTVSPQFQTEPHEGTRRNQKGTRRNQKEPEEIAMFRNVAEDTVRQSQVRTGIEIVANTMQLIDIWKYERHKDR